MALGCTNERGYIIPDQRSVQNNRKKKRNKKKRAASHQTEEAAAAWKRTIKIENSVPAAPSNH